MVFLYFSTVARRCKMCCMAMTMTPQVQFRTIDGIQIRYAAGGV
jgi:hypothetical protein